MAWKVTIEDKSMLLDDLTEQDFVDATKDNPEVTWLRLYVSPGADPAAFYTLLCKCAAKLDVPAPAKPKNIKESVALLKYVEQVEDDLPKAFSEGGIPLGSTADAKGTTTSSTSTAPASGIQRGPAARP